MNIILKIINVVNTDTTPNIVSLSLVVGNKGPIITINANNIAESIPPQKYKKGCFIRLSCPVFLPYNLF